MATALFIPLSTMQATPRHFQNNTYTMQQTFVPGHFFLGYLVVVFASPISHCCPTFQIVLEYLNLRLAMVMILLMLFACCGTSTISNDLLAYFSTFFSRHLVDRTSSIGHPLHVKL